MNLYNKVCVALSVLLLASMGAQTFFVFHPGVYVLLNVFDAFVCSFFCTDWFIKLINSENKWKFLKWGWFDLLLCIPVSHEIWVQYHSILRLIRSVKCLKIIYDVFSEDKKTSKFMDCCVVGIIFIVFSSIAVFNCEKHAEGANIKNLSDSIWWSMATITTIGYGDRYPVTDIGRFIGGIVMLGGVGLYASFTGFIVSKFITDDRIDHLVAENEKLHNKLDELLATNNKNE